MARYLFLATILLFFSWNVFAESNEIKCEPLEGSSSNKEIILPGPSEPHSSVVYFFKNKTSKSIWVDHPVTNSAMSAGWSSFLRAGNASALLVNRKNFTMNCAVIGPGKVEYLDCAESISVCKPSNVTLTTTRKGTFWLAEDKPWDELIKLLAKRGVVVK